MSAEGAWAGAGGMVKEFGEVRQVEEMEWGLFFVCT